MSQDGRHEVLYARMENSIDRRREVFKPYCLRCGKEIVPSFTDWGKNMEVAVLFGQFTLLPFLQAAAWGKLDKQDYITWGQQMLYLAMCFKKSMSRGIEQSLSVVPPALSVGCSLAGNLYDEFGQGIEGCCHIEMLQRFVTILGGQPFVPMLESTRQCIAAHEALSLQGLAANLASIWTNEVCCPIEFRAVREGIAKLPGTLPLEELYRYLDVNLDADVEHSQSTFRVLRPFVLTEARVTNVAVQKSIQALTVFYEGLMKEVSIKV